MAEMSLKDIENELDDLSIRILELMNDNINCKLNVEKAVRSGCLDLAKTRYILGNTNSISAMKIPTEELSATSTIVHLEEEENKPVFELKRETVQKVSENKSKSTNQDPIKWFGILVPTNLRQAQSWFVKALDLSVESANISTNISESLDKYKKLISNKNLLRSKTE